MSSEAGEQERAERERRERGMTFREVAHDYLRWLEHVRGAKPATLLDYRRCSLSPACRTGAARASTSGTS